MESISIYPPTLDGKNIEQKRQEILKYFNNTYELFEKIFELLENDKVFYKKSEPTRHPMIFYFGHTATFFINKLILMKIIDKRVDANFESIFAIGVDEMEWDDVNSKNYSWPKVEEVRRYRNIVKKIVQDLICKLEFELPIKQNSAMWIILMGIEHERIHIETSLVLHRQMPLQFIKNIKELNICTHSSKSPKNDMVKISSQAVKLGKNINHNLYGWDNEYGVYKESVNEFKVSKYLVSNAEFMEFVENNGYEREEFWDEEGLKYLKNTNAKHPVFWILKDGVYKYRAISQIIDMPLDWPVDVNALEAQAFCKYKSKIDGVTYMLPSEAEYRAIYEQTNIEDLPDFDQNRANLNFYHYASSSPVNEFAFHTKNGEVIYDVVGNVWQWSRTFIHPFDGFKVHEAYDDFSVPTFDEKHLIIVGSSWASSGNLIMKHSRYAFRKHFPQNAGFRYVISNNQNDNKLDIYESDELVSQYCEFQYGDEYFGVKNFSKECAKIGIEFSKNKTKALDLGCATARASFELAKEFDEVEGIDFSARFIQVGVQLKQKAYISFSSKIEGDLVENKKITLNELGYENIAHKVSFWQGDACNLKPNFNSYDLIMATNLIDRLYNPKLFLETIHKRLNSDGILMITSPYSWQESSTQKEMWLGGFVDKNGNEIKTLNTLKKILSENFELIHLKDIEFVIKESARKFQHTIAQCSIWKKR